MEKEKIFHTNRIMFYFKEEDIQFPSYEFRNSSHQKWMNYKNVDIEKHIRGYILNNNVYLYIGNDFKVPNISYRQIETIKSIFPNIYHIYLGCIKGNVGEQWKPILEISIKELNN